MDKYNTLNFNKIICAVSGGIDSVVLLDLIAKNTDPENIIVAHINHGVRKESQDEAIFVENLAKKYGLCFESSKLKINNPTEENLRNARYNYLKKVKEKYNAKYIATAHHLNDQAETVIFNLIRGTGPTEIWGMKEIEGDLWRPLLAFSKKEIELYAKSNKLKSVFDKSNLNTKYSRNRIRHNVIPEIEKINQSFLETIKREVTLGQELEAYIKEETQKTIKKIAKENIIDLYKFLKLNGYLKKQVIFEFLKKFTPKNDGIYQKNVTEILKVIEGKGNKKTKIAGFTIAKNYDKIIFDFIEQRSQKKLKLKLGENTYNGWLINVEKNSQKRPNKNNIILPTKYLDNLSAREWKPGDKIETKIGSKKIQDIFTDMKLSAQDKKHWPIIVSRQKIVWVPKLQASKESLDDKKSNNLIIEVKNEKRK